jgi:hypothetical protein
MLEWFGQKYGEDQYYFLWRSIGYFTDADNDPNIKGLGKYKADWNDVKEYIVKHCIS